MPIVGGNQEPVFRKERRARKNKNPTASSCKEKTGCFCLQCHRDFFLRKGTPAQVPGGLEDSRLPSVSIRLRKKKPVTRKKKGKKNRRPGFPASPGSSGSETVYSGPPLLSEEKGRGATEQDKRENSIGPVPRGMPGGEEKKKTYKK